MRGEVHFFDKRDNFSKGRGWYEARFRGATTERAIGDKTPAYCWANGDGAEGHLPEVHRNLHAFYPDAKWATSVTEDAPMPKTSIEMPVIYPCLSYRDAPAAMEWPAGPSGS